MANKEAVTKLINCSPVMLFLSPNKNIGITGVQAVI